MLDPLLIFEFNQRYIKLENGCWSWIGDSKHSHGYGRLQFNKQRYLAHRLSYLIHKGDYDQNLDVLHTCDYHLCVNPEHLFLGDQAANNQDCRDKMRHAYGERHGNAHLQKEDIIAIRLEHSLGTSHNALSIKYNVSRAQITRIINRTRWKDI